MRHENSVFHELLKHVPWGRFEELVEKHGANFRVRRLTAKSHFLALLYAQLAGASSLREIEAALQSHSARLYHAGAREVSRSTLSDANAARPYGVFAELFAYMTAGATPCLRRATRSALRLVDASPLFLNPSLYRWARLSGTWTGAKLHVVYDPAEQRPTYFSVTPANVNDITVAQGLVLEPGATYVFDKGYCGFGWWAELHQSRCRFVTRLKNRSPFHVLEERAVNQPDIVSDRIGRLNGRMAKSRINPLADVGLREIVIRIDKKRTLRLVTNDLKSTARTIAELYKQRWDIELFFRWIKQNLKIKRFIGTSENAVRIQIAVALIAFLILRSARNSNQHKLGPLAFARLVRTNLMHRRSIANIQRPPPQPQTTNQFVLDLACA